MNKKNICLMYAIAFFQGIVLYATISTLYRDGEIENYNLMKWGCKIMSEANELLKNLDKLHTTELGVARIKKNLSLDTDDVVGWCREKINSDKSVITRNGKNWYVHINACIITVNAYSYTIITAHKEKDYAKIYCFASRH